MLIGGTAVSRKQSTKCYFAMIMHFNASNIWQSLLGLFLLYTNRNYWHICNFLSVLISSLPSKNLNAKMLTFKNLPWSCWVKLAWRNQRQKNLYVQTNVPRLCCLNIKCMTNGVVNIQVLIWHAALGILSCQRENDNAVYQHITWSFQFPLNVSQMF